MRWGLIWGLCALSLAGCPRDELTLTIELEGGAMRREIHAVRVDDGRPIEAEPPLLKALAEAYGVNPSADEGRALRLDKRFSAEALRAAWPQDIGGEGELLHHGGALGDLTWYAEHLRGGDDPYQQVTSRGEAVVKLVALLEGFFKSNFGQEPDYPQFEQFIKGDLTKDIQSLVAFLWSTNRIGTVIGLDEAKKSDDQRYSVIAAQVGHFLINRRYITPLEFATLMDSFNRNEEARQIEVLKRILSRLLKDKVKLDTRGALYAKLSTIFDDLKALEARFQAWLGPEEGPLRDALTAQSKLILLELSGPGGPGDLLKLRVKSPQPPIFTNGVYADGIIRWEGHLPAREGMAGRPALSCLALWLTPNAANQRAAFGEVIIEGDLLRELLFWEAQLSPAAQAAWAAFFKGGPRDEAALLALELPGERRPAEDKHHPLHKIIARLKPASLPVKAR